MRLAGRGTHLSRPLAPGVCGPQPLLPCAEKRKGGPGSRPSPCPFYIILPKVKPFENKIRKYPEHYHSPLNRRDNRGLLRCAAVLLARMEGYRIHTSVSGGFALYALMRHPGHACHPMPPGHGFSCEWQFSCPFRAASDWKEATGKRAAACAGPGIERDGRCLSAAPADGGWRAGSAPGEVVTMMDFGRQGKRRERRQGGRPRRARAAE